MTPADILNDVIRISLMAGALLKERFSTDLDISYKGEVDIVTDVDREAQELIENEIRNRYPDHGILAEEELDTAGSSGYRWIVDPLDGTTNYAHRFPVFSVSIAVAREGETLCGVVYNPMSGEMFKAVQGEGASLNAFPISVSGITSLDRSLLGTGFPYNIRETADTNLNHFQHFAVRTQGIRRCGSAALDLCFVACGRLDGFWELNLKAWDIAAGALIVREAGGVTSDFGGAELGLDGSEVLATNGHIHREMIDVLRSAAGKGKD